MRLGIFGQADGGYVRLLQQAAVARGDTVQILAFEQFSARILAGKPRFFCGDVSLDALDAVLVRTMPPGSLEQVIARMDLLAGLQASGIRVVNPPRALECAVDKYLTTQRLAEHGIPVPDTIVCEGAEAALQAFEQLGRDVVVKPLFGAEGRGIVRVTDFEIAVRVFRALERISAVLYVQRFVAGPAFDLRFLLLDGQLLGAMQRTPRPGDFRANISQQGTGTPWQPAPAETELALAAAKVVGAVFSGVDLMYDHNGQLVVIEINAVPGWRGLQQACAVDVPQLLLDWLQHTCQG
jgi:ribosomal protein S6--L-glutamate ligase